ncbi:MAG: ABC transporter ATP-binding protein [Bryobacteraceae bacterium]
MNPVLELREVSRHFSGVVAVDRVSLEVEAGALFALLGPSGCGKTTILRMVAGLDHPSSGAIFLNGKEAGARPPYERNVSTVFQSYALFPHMTVRENIAYGLERRGAGDVTSRVDATAAMLGIGGLLGRRPAQISGGEKQRVALARSLVLEPGLLLLDEPLSALDPNLRAQVRLELKALQRRVGIAFVMVTHDKEEALAMADKVALMNRGRLEQVGSPADVYLRPATRFAASFLGAVNWIGDAGVRPEAIRVSVSRPGGDVLVREAVVRETMFLGDRVQLTAEAAGQASITAQLSRLDGPFAPGDAVHLWWLPADELRLSA